MSTIENHPETRELKKAVETFTDQLQGLRASNGYDDADASEVLRPLCRAVVNLFKVAADDDEIVDILTMAGKGAIDSVTARVIVEYSFRAEEATASVHQMFSEWMRCQGREEQAVLLARKTQEGTVIDAEQAGVIDRLIRVLNNSNWS